VLQKEKAPQPGIAAFVWDYVSPLACVGGLAPAQLVLYVETDYSTIELKRNLFLPFHVEYSDTAETGGLIGCGG
jgi:hypothetical protein